VRNKKVLVKFGLHLRKLREGKGLSQQELADFAEVDKTTINNLEHSKFNPKLDTIISIAQALGITLKEIFDF
jgi:DNA-binding XRE family transcriptional regulator